MKQKALVKYAKGYGNVEIREIDVPKIPHDDWVLIKIKASGVCGTDVHVWQDLFQSWPPVILGHEFAGKIVETGKAVKRFKPGDRVVAEPNTGGCCLCEYCRSGRMHMCIDKQTLGWRTNGTFTDYIALPEIVLHKIPDGLSYELAALTEPLAIVIYDVAERGKTKCNDFVVIKGSGPMGLLSAYVAKMQGASTVLLTGIDSSEYCRFDMARQLGADFTLNVMKENLAEKTMELTGGKGADVVIETSGAPSAINGSVELLKRGGRIIGVGIPTEQELLFPWKDAVLKSIEIIFSMSSSYTSWDKALGKLRQDSDILKKIITYTGTIDQWESVFNSLAAEKDIKAMFLFDQ